MAEQPPLTYRLRVHAPDGTPLTAAVEPRAASGELELARGKLSFKLGKLAAAVGLKGQDDPPPPAVMHVPLKGTFGSAEAASSWLAAHPVRVEVDGAPIAFHTSVGKDGSIRVHFEAPAGRHRLRVASVPAAGAPIVWLDRESTVSPKE